MQQPLPPPATWSRRILQLGPSRIALALAILLALVALALPLWAVAATETGGDRFTRSYGWTTVMDERFENGVWDMTSYQSYASPNFNERSLAGVMGTSYFLILMYLLLVIVSIILFSWRRTKLLPPVGLLILSLLVVALGIVSIMYPVLAVPSALGDLQPLLLSGWSGSTDFFGASLTWGAATGWWLVLASLVLAVIGVVLPYMESVRLGPSPQTWRAPP